MAHGACLDRLQQAIALRPGSHVAVMLGEALSEYPQIDFSITDDYVLI